MKKCILIFSLSLSICTSMHIIFGSETKKLLVDGASEQICKVIVLPFRIHGEIFDFGLYHFGKGREIREILKKESPHKHDSYYRQYILSLLHTSLGILSIKSLFLVDLGLLSLALIACNKRIRSRVEKIALDTALNAVIKRYHSEDLYDQQFDRYNAIHLHY